MLGEEGSCCQSDGNLPPTKISYSSDIIRPPCRRDNDGGWVHTLTRNVWPTYLLSSVETSVRALKMDWGGGEAVTGLRLYMFFPRLLSLPFITVEDDGQAWLLGL